MSEVRDDPQLRYLQSAFAAAHERVLELIDDFEQHSQRYLQSDYQEAEARKDFIDPFLKALGWDVDHERERNPYEQEVKVERGVSVARSQKRADYAFYLKPNFRDVRFFVEAKKPSIDLTHSTDAHFQTWRYGYSANTPLAVLTDFEQVHVLDCRARPHPDAALDRVWKKWHCTEFRNPEKFAEFYWLFSREAHADGSFQRRVDELPKPRGGARQRGLFRGGYQAVDESFLAELEEHREALAKAFKKADHALDSETLTAIVQRALDRLVFLRFLEDKQIETEIRVSDFGRGGSAWRDFVNASRRLDSIYNGIVFKREPPLDDAAFAPDDAVFADVCEKLAAENSPYNFDAIPIHILGSIYERFLGSVIRATAARVTIEQKPEVRKAGGVYYTPEYIVRYIVAQTVGKLIEGKAPAEVAKLRFADIACGSGSFLLGVFDELLRHHAEWYNRTENESKAKKDGCVKGEDGRWRLSLAQRRAILLNNIHGVDIDRQAVEVAQLSLFLKLLEDERAVSARQYQLDYARDPNLKKLLPDLSSNIVCGNSLIGWDVADLAGLSPEDERRLNPLDFADAFREVMRNGGFDAVVGNPPYVRIQTLKEAHPLAAAMLKEKYIAASKGNFDIYVVFIERALSLLNACGTLGYIVPHKFFNAKYGEPMRGLIAKGKHLSKIVHFGDQQVFEGATTYTCLLFLAKTKAGGLEYTKCEDLAAWSLDPHTDLPAEISIDGLSGSEWNFSTGAAGNLIARLGAMPTLGSLCDRIFQGIIPGADKVYALDVRSTVGSLSICYSRALDKEVEIERAILRPLISGPNVGRYLFGRSPIHVIYPYEISTDSSAELISPAALRSHFPRAYSYLLESRTLLDARDGGSARGPHWYRYIRTQNIALQMQPKLAVPRLVSRLKCSIDVEGSVCLDNVDVGGILPKDEIGSRLYILGLLNSQLLDFVFRQQAAPFRGGFFSANRQFIERLPIRPIDFSNSTDRSHHDQIVTLVEQMLEAKKQEAAATGQAKEIATRKCASLDRKINALVYELYGLTGEEIELVERGSTT